MRSHFRRETTGTSTRGKLPSLCWKEREKEREKKLFRSQEKGGAGTAPVLIKKSKRNNWVPGLLQIGGGEKKEKSCRQREGIANDRFKDGNQLKKGGRKKSKKTHQ